MLERHEPTRYKVYWGCRSNVHVRFIFMVVAVPDPPPSLAVGRKKRRPEELGEATTDVANNVGEAHQGKNHHADGVTASGQDPQVEK